MRELNLVLLILGFCFNSGFSQNPDEQLSNELLKLHKDSGLPGFAVAIVTSDSICYKNAIGFENLETKSPFLTDQRFFIASISKTFIGLGLMKLIEKGELTLSTPINSILPFEIQHPHFPNAIITVEHLARHTSGLLYDNLETKSWYLDAPFGLTKKSVGKMAYRDFSAWGENSAIDLGVFLKECLTKNGRLYSKAHFSKQLPGKQYTYSNLGAALAAYIIELKTGVAYKEYISNLVKKELGFSGEIWRNGSEILPTTYFQNTTEVPAHIPILYPAGGMMFSCDELALYLSEMIKGLEGNSQLLTKESFEIMMSSLDVENPKGGIFWELNGDKIGHNGGNYGVTCFMSFDKKTGIGKLFMTNISAYQDGKLLNKMIAIWKKIGEYESTF